MREGKWVRKFKETATNTRWRGCEGAAANLIVAVASSTGALPRWAAAAAEAEGEEGEVEGAAPQQAELRPVALPRQQTSRQQSPRLVAAMRPVRGVRE